MTPTSGKETEMRDAKRLYDVLDRLVFDLLDQSKQAPEHRYSPLGSALNTLHELRCYETEHCICAQQYANPPQ